MVGERPHYTDLTMIEDRIDLATDGGTMDCYLRRPEGDAPRPPILFYMDAPGIRPHLLDMAARLASHGYVVLVPNLYYRQGPHEPFDPAVAFTEGPVQDRMRSFLKGVDNTLVMRDTAACLAYLDGQRFVARPRVGCVGYCMGGRQALMAAGTFPDRVVAAASLHGAALATDRADSPHRLVAKMRAALYLGVAEVDRTFPREQQDRLETALREAGVRFTLEVYPGTRHGFAVTDHPVYDEAASERHWPRVLALLDAALAGEGA